MKMKDMFNALKRAVRTGFFEKNGDPDEEYYTLIEDARVDGSTISAMQVVCSYMDCNNDHFVVVKDGTKLYVYSTYEFHMSDSHDDVFPAKVIQLTGKVCGKAMGYKEEIAYELCDQTNYISWW